MKPGQIVVTKGFGRVGLIYSIDGDDIFVSIIRGVKDPDAKKPWLASQLRAPMARDLHEGDTFTMDDVKDTDGSLMEMECISRWPNVRSSALSDDMEFSFEGDEPIQFLEVKGK